MRQLAADVGGVCLDLVAGEDWSGTRAPGWVADHGRAAADEGDRSVAGALEVRHRHDWQEVTDV